MKVVRQEALKKYRDYTSYKRFLRVDFKHRCAFCGVHERIYGPLSAMSIDHFRPRELFPNLLTEYSNLYYCCGECNTKKGTTWPNDQQFAQGFRFVDVCEDEWTDHLEFRDDVIRGKTPAGHYTVQHVGLARAQLVERYRDLRLKEADARSDLEEIRQLRTRLGSKIGADTQARLTKLEMGAEARLRALMTPDPLAG